MKADSRTEAEIMAVLNKLSEAYARRDINTFLSLFAQDPDTVFFGTGEDEKRVGLNELKMQVERDWSQSEATSLNWGWHSISMAGPVAWAAMDANFKAKVSGRDITSPGRMTAVLEKRGDRWLIVQWHLSAPMSEQPAGESFPTMRQMR